MQQVNFSHCEIVIIKGICLISIINQETEGVCVATYGDNKDFPAFFTPSSEFKAAYNVQTPYQAAQMIRKIL